MVRLSDTGFVRSVNSGKGLDVTAVSLAPGARLQQWPFLSEQANQRFRFSPLDDGFHRITALHSGLVLDVAGGSLDRGAPIIQWNWHGGPNQRFAVDEIDTGSTSGRTFLLRAQHSGLVLDVVAASQDNGAAIIQWDRHGGPNQQWRLSVPFD
jgi:hypothetical protein